MILLLALSLLQTPFQAPLGPPAAFDPPILVRLPFVPSVDISPALNLLETVRLRVDPKTGKVVKRRRTRIEIQRELACGSLIRSLQVIAHSLSL